ncbi:putative reverse transcriptase domain-containing protein, partial [Tanacetum coccineum]
MNMTIQSSIKGKILATQNEAFEVVNAPAEMLRGLDEQMERRSDGSLYFLDRIWDPLMGDVRTLIIDEAPKSKYFIHPGADKMYYDLKDMYWWPGMKKDIAMTKSGHDSIWVSMDRLTKFAHSIPIYEDFKMDRLARIYLNEIMVRHGVSISIISYRDGRFTSQFWQSMPKALGTRLDMSTAYHPQTDGQSEHSIQTLEDMLKACVIDFGGSWDVHLPLVEFHTTIAFILVLGVHRSKHCMRESVVHPSYGLKAARDRQKSYADKRRKPLEFSIELSSVHDTFYVLNLKKCLADPTLHVPLEEIQVDAKLNFVEEPVEILEREIKKLKRSRITIVKMKRILNNIKLAGLLADLRSPLEDSIYGDCILGVLFLVYVLDLLDMYHSDSKELICNNFRPCDVTRLVLAQVPYLLSEDV